ncbi:MAG TPA: hypothetical protein VEB19_17445 [Gemmatimonadaceae bacterium]|nr:hypothetical protein [Gemmatimonadaceae bacterium]
MPSPDKARRAGGGVVIGRILRVVAYSAIVAWIWIAMRPAPGVEVVAGSSLTNALPRWTLAPTESVHVQFDTVPDARSRAWLVALRGAATSVSWSSNAIQPVALETVASVEPAGGAIILAAAGSTDSSVRRSDSLTAASTVMLSDALGTIDSVDIGSGPVSVRLGDHQGLLTLTSGQQPARVAVPASPSARRVLVSGAAGWEAKFIIAALEEAGWRVDASLFVGPGHLVAQSMTPSADTSRHAAVVLVDTVGAALVRGVEPFVRQGGGLVLVGDASRRREVASLIAWRAGRRANAPLGTPPGDTSWHGLTRVPFEVNRDHAIVLARHDGQALVAARRHYAGRVIAVGHDDTWRWRMAGGANSVAEHRAWWSRTVASVAQRHAPATTVATGAAPVASLYRELGVPSGTTRTPPVIPRQAIMNVLGAIAFATLLVEWLMRRLRGAR